MPIVTEELADYEALDDLCERCMTAFRDTTEVDKFLYPAQLVGNANADLWENQVADIRALNEELLSQLRGNVTNYGLYTRAGAAENWQLRYLGQTKSTLARSRISNHLIKKNRKTGSKLPLVQEQVARGVALGVRLVQVEPEFLRQYVEEILIGRFRQNLVDWNVHG